MKELMLLIAKASYFPTRYSKDDEQLLWPRALRLLPIWGLLAGVIMMGSVNILHVLGLAAAASCLLAIDVLFGCGIYLKDIINFADGIAPRMDKPQSTTTTLSETKVRIGYPGMIAAMAFLLLKYGVYYQFIKYNEIGIIASSLPAAFVFSRWVYVWLVYDFATWGTNFLHQSFRREDFRFASIITMVIMFIMASSFLWPTLIISLIAVYCWAMIRKKQGGMYQACYGAISAWSEVLFLVVFIFFQWFIT